MKKFFANYFRPSDSALESLESRKKSMLKAIIIMTGMLAAFGLIYVFILDNFSPGLVTPEDKNFIYSGCFILLAGVLFSTILEKRGALQLAIYVFIGMLVIVIVSTDNLTEILYGRSNMLLLLPIVLAGVFLSSRAAYLVMLITSILSIIGWYIERGWKGEGLPNVPAITAMIFFAFLIEWPMSFLERALKKLQNSNKSLEESEKRYRRLVNALPVGVIVHDQGIVNYMNPTGAKIMGIKKTEDAIGAPVFERIHPDYHEIVSNRIQQVSSGETVAQIEEKFIRMDGVAFDAEVSTLPFEYGSEQSTLAIFADITERKKAQQELIERNKRLQEVSQQLLEVQEQEKHALAIELHDDLGQSLTSLKMMLELAGNLPPAKRKKTIEDSGEVVYELMSKVRNLSLDLRPAMLDDFGLFPALRGLFDRFYARTQIEIHADFDLESEQRFDARIETAAFRIIQEALTNIARYASVKEAFVSINVDNTLHIRVEDHGQGFDLDDISQRQALSSGISGMQERARLVGGRVGIFSELGKGTHITAEIPLI